MDREFGLFEAHEGPLSTDERIAELRGLLSDRVVTVGNGKASVVSGALDSIVELIDSESVEVEVFAPVMKAFAQRPDYVRQLADQHMFNELSNLVQLHQRRRGLESLRRRAADPGTSDLDMLQLIKEQWWVFGGHLVPMQLARTIDGLPDRCLAMVRFDMAIHLILIETHNVPDLVTQRPDGYYTIAACVYQALEIGRNLVFALAEINTELEFEARRIFVTVLIGHPDHVTPQIPMDVVREEIRQLNTCYVGCAVLTYDELLHAAEQTLPGMSD